MHYRIQLLIICITVNIGLFFGIQGMPQSLQLAIAVRDKKKDEIAFLLQQGVDFNAQDYTGSTALHNACTAPDDSADIDIVTALLAAPGIQCDALGAEGTMFAGLTPLYTAIQRGSITKVKALLEKGADPNRKIKNISYLHLAVIRHTGDENFDEIVQELLKHNANPNTTDPKGNTPLHIAQKKGLQTCSNLLKNHGANETLTNNNGQTPAQSSAVIKPERTPLIGILCGSAVVITLGSMYFRVQHKDKKQQSHQLPVQQAPAEQSIEYIPLTQEQTEELLAEELDSSSYHHRP